MIAAVLVGGCGQDTWRGFLYPDRNNLTKDVRSGPLKTLEQCRSWVDATREEMDLDRVDIDYECGKNCKPPRTPDGPMVCEETVR